MDEKAQPFHVGVDTVLFEFRRDGLIDVKRRDGKPVYRNGQPVFVLTPKGRAYCAGEDAGWLDTPDPT